MQMAEDRSVGLALGETSEDVIIYILGNLAHYEFYFLEYFASPVLHLSTRYRHNVFVYLHIVTSLKQ